jgi:hypothetical protein
MIAPNDTAVGDETATASQAVRQLAREAAEKYPNPKDARRHLRSVIDGSDDRDAMWDALIDMGVGHLIYSVRHVTMTTVKQNACTRDITVIAAASSLYKKFLLDRWTMPDGRALGDWTGVELKPIAAEEGRLARGHQDKSKFYGELSTRAGNRAVRRAMKPAEVDELWKTISGEDGQGIGGAQKSAATLPAQNNASGQAWPDSQNRRAARVETSRGKRGATPLAVPSVSVPLAAAAS